MTRSRRRLGKWRDDTIPHRGWRLVSIHELDCASAICAMCESQPIRIVYTMTHGDYPKRLKVGRHCAAKMEDDRNLFLEREEYFRLRDRFYNGRWRWLKYWPTRYLNLVGLRIEIYQEPHSDFGYRIIDRRTRRTVRAEYGFGVPHKADDAAFEAMVDWLAVGRRSAFPYTQEKSREATQIELP